MSGGVRFFSLEQRFHYSFYTVFTNKDKQTSQKYFQLQAWKRLGVFLLTELIRKSNVSTSLASIVQSLNSAGRKGYLTSVLPGTFPTAQMGNTMHFITSTFTTLMKYTNSVHLWNQREGKEISSKEQVFLLLKLPLLLVSKNMGNTE